MRFKNQKGNNRFLKHYGMPRRSGRYPWGSGKKPQRNKNIYNVYLQLHQEGFTDRLYDKSVEPNRDRKMLLGPRPFLKKGIPK